MVPLTIGTITRTTSNKEQKLCSSLLYLLQNKRDSEKTTKLGTQKVVRIVLVKVTSSKLSFQTSQHVVSSRLQLSDHSSPRIHLTLRMPH